jgi:hypothetical protein
MESKHHPSREELERSTDPQQSEMDHNIHGGIFQALAGDSKGRQDADMAGPSASQTGGVEDEKEEEKGRS